MEQAVGFPPNGEVSFSKEELTRLKGLANLGEEQMRRYIEAAVQTPQVQAARIVALEMETEALKTVVAYLLWARAYSVEGEARGEAVDYRERLAKAWEEAQEQRR